MLIIIYQRFSESRKDKNMVKKGEESVVGDFGPLLGMV